MTGSTDSDKQPPELPRRRKFRRVMQVVLAILLAIAASGWGIYSYSQREPLFYQQALLLNEQEADALGDEFEKEVLLLQNNARFNPIWQAVFSEDQINGWLSADFQQTLPGVLPDQVVDPRVGIDVDELSLGFQFEYGQMQGIVNARIDAFCTDVPGQIAVRIKSVKSGLVPIPVRSIADQVSESLRSIGADVEWTEIENDPVALIEMPPNAVKLGKMSVHLESIQLLENQLILSGSSTPND